MPYLESITVAQKKQARYYNLIKRRGTNKIPPSLNKQIGTNYKIDENGFLIDLLTNDKVISNKFTVGKPVSWIINFQPIYNGSLNPIQRSVYMNIIKNLLKDWIDIQPIVEFPLKLELFIFAKEMKTDVDNRGVIYFKTITDLLVTKKIIPDDSSEYIRDTGRCVWIPTPKHKEKMEFHISKIE